MRKAFFRSLLALRSLVRALGAVVSPESTIAPFFRSEAPPLISWFVIAAAATATYLFRSPSTESEVRQKVTRPSFSREENTMKNMHALCLLAVIITVSTGTALAHSASSPKAASMQSRATEVDQNTARQVTVPEDVLNRLIGQCERHFRHAAKRFAHGDNPGAASQIHVGSTLLSLEAGRGHAETQNALSSAADELDRLASRVEHGDVSSRNELNEAFAHADLALAAHYRAMADEAIANKEHDNAGRWLNAAADSVDDAAR